MGAAKKVGATSVRKDEVVNHIYNDICNGATYTNCLNKLMNDDYEVGHKYSESRADKLIQMARKLIRQDFEEDRKEIKARLYVAIQDVFNECREANDRSNALKALDQISKLLGLNEPDKIDMRLQNVDINFGF
jgi:L-fucose isomerase-like protein